eukprot:2494338-Lingulodinium_polyedra.AAC.1
MGGIGACSGATGGGCATAPYINVSKRTTRIWALRASRAMTLTNDGMLLNAGPGRWFNATSTFPARNVASCWVKVAAQRANTVSSNSNWFRASSTG